MPPLGPRPNIRLRERLPLDHPSPSTAVRAGPHMQLLGEVAITSEEAANYVVPYLGDVRSGSLERKISILLRRGQHRRSLWAAWSCETETLAARSEHLGGDDPLAPIGRNEHDGVALIERARTAVIAARIPCFVFKRGGGSLLFCQGVVQRRICASRTLAVREARPASPRLLPLRPHGSEPARHPATDVQRLFWTDCDRKGVLGGCAHGFGGTRRGVVATLGY
jgi:hypothetical protein